MKLKHRLSEPELLQLQQLMLREPRLPGEIENPSALVDLLGRGLVRLEHGRYWVEWENIGRTG
jgi:hypothetical protein